MSVLRPELLKKDTNTEETQQLCPLCAGAGVTQVCPQQLPPSLMRSCGLCTDGCLSDRLQPHCWVFAVLRAGTSEPVRDGDICIFKFSTSAMCCSVCMAGHQELHAHLAAWRAVATMIVV